MADITMYTTAVCPIASVPSNLLRSKGVTDINFIRC